MSKTSNDEFLIKVKADISQATAELRKLTGEINNSGHAGTKAGKGMSAMTGSMTTLLTLGSAYIALNFASKLLKQADAWNVLQARIKTATRATGDYVSVSSELYRITQQNGQAMETTVSLFQNLARTAPELGATNAQMLALTNTVQQLGVISGTTLSQQRAGLLQFTQGLAGGVFRAEEFNSLIENLPELANRIAKGLGKTTGELRNMVLEGKVLSKDVFDAIQKQAPEIAEQFKEMPLSIERAASKLDTSFDHFLGQLDEALGITQLMAEALDSAANALDALTAPDREIKPLTQEEARGFNKQITEQIQLLQKRNEVIRKIAPQDRSAQQNLELAKNIREIAILKRDLIALDDESIDRAEEQNRKIFERSAILKAGYQQTQKLLDEQWFAEDEAAVRAEESAQRRLEKQQALAAAEERRLEKVRKLAEEKERAAQAEQREKSKLQSLIDTLIPAEKATHDLQRNLELIDKAWADGEISDERYQKMTDALLGFNNEADNSKDKIDALIAATKGWGDQFTNALVEMAMTGKLSFKDLADSIIRDLLRMMVYQNLVKPLFGALGVPGFETKGKPSAPVPSFPEFHNGGIAGSGGTYRAANAMAFIGASRYHSGGIAGLKPNEVPAILEQGEEVLTRNDPRHRANAARNGAVTVQIENKGTPIEAQSADVSFDADGMVVKVMTTDIKNGGPISRSLQNTFNLRR